MDRRNVTDLQGAVHQGLFNSHTGDFIDISCDAGRRTVVRPYEKLHLAQLTENPLTCDGCQAAVTGTAPHPADVARRIADAVIAEADGRGYPPSSDSEALRLAFVRLVPDGGELRPVFQRLARGVYDPENSYRTEPLYALVQEHLADSMTARALEVPEGTPRVLVEYTRFTGGTVQAPVGVGDRLMRNGIASGIWYTATVTAVDTHRVTVREDKDGTVRRWDRHDFRRWFFKLDRAPHPARTAS